MRQYELLLMLDPEVDEERIEVVMAHVKSVIGEHDGEIVDEDGWGRRKLAYKIGAYSEANYRLAHLRMEGGGSTELESSLKLTDDVIRHMLLRQDDE